MLLLPYAVEYIERRRRKGKVSTYDVTIAVKAVKSTSEHLSSVGLLLNEMKSDKAFKVQLIYGE